MKDTKFSDFTAGIALAILGGIIFTTANSLPKAQLGLGSGGYPKVISIVLIILGILQAINVVITQGFPKFTVGKIDKASFLPSFLAIVATFAYVILLKHIGFVILTPIYMVGMMRIFAYKKIINSIIISLITTAFIYFLFVKIFMIFLPSFSLLG